MIYLGLTILVAILFQGTAKGATYKNRYLAGYGFDVSHPNDWLTCSLKCQHLQHCVSYNFDFVSGRCELNNYGLISEQKPAEQLIQANGFIFHQLRPVIKNIVPVKRIVQDQCDCRCQSACTSKHGKKKDKPLPFSCNDLWQKKRPASGAYKVQLGSEKVRLFCQMNDSRACGSGGWTLVMKIDGSKPTFAFNSPMWTNKMTFNSGNGNNLADNEVKLSSYWSIPMKKLCLGMKYRGKTHWIVVKYNAKSLYDVIIKGDNRRANVDPETWKSLIENSYVETGCIWEGFNAKSNYTKAAQARIGIVGGKTCGPPNSRIGFGTGGSHYGMNGGNACGNEFKTNTSMMTFGYILVQ